jgi:integrase
LERHAVGVRPRTVATLRDRLSHAVRAFGDERLSDLERMSDEIAGWQAQLPPRAGHGIAQALRQALDAAVRWGHITRNPAKLAGSNPKPPPRPVRAFTRAEVEAIAAELSGAYRPLPAFASATGLRPEEWIALERRDLDRVGGVLAVARSRRARSCPLPRRAAVAAGCRSRPGRSPRSMSFRRGSTRRCCSRRPRAGC